MVYPMVSAGPQAHPLIRTLDVRFCPNPPAPQGFSGRATKVEAAPEEQVLPLAGVTGREGTEAPLRGVASMDDTSPSPWPSAHSPAPLFHLDQLWALSLLIVV